MLEPRDVGAIAEAVARTFGLAARAEMTLEVNPEDVTRERLDGFRAAGVNRLSLGVQALDDRFLRALGREHDAATAVRSVEIARVCGFDDVSFDLIFAVQGGEHGAAMTLAEWEATLARAIALAPTHISCYGLTVERGTVLDRLVARGAEALVEEDTQAAMYELAVQRLGAAGLPRYEVSNFAAPGHRAVHNSLYWRYAEWLGFGPSAHSFLRVGTPRSREAGGVRFWNDKNPVAWMKRGGAPSGGQEVITGRAAMGEFAFTSLRLVEGMRDGDFAAIFGVMPGEIFGAELARLEKIGLVVREGEMTRLTDRGYLLSDSVFADLVA